MTYPFRDVKQMKLSDKRLWDVWREMAEDKQKIVFMIMDAIKTKTELTDEQKLDCLGLLPSFSDDEFALLCYYAALTRTNHGLCVKEIKKHEYCN